VSAPLIALSGVTLAAAAASATLSINAASPPPAASATLSINAASPQELRRQRSQSKLLLTLPEAWAA
jgi:hypothetical protein